MKIATQKSVRIGLRVLRGIIVGILIFLALGIWLMWPSMAMERYAVCDNNYSIWRRNPGAWSGYVYEIRDGVVPIETGLRTSQLKDRLKDQHCLVLGGG